jgi:hypothetical protein
MSDLEIENEVLFAGLRALAESAFPKHCPTCGRQFESAQQFIENTHSIRSDKSGLKQSFDDGDNTIVEMYRNCPCGSTLMDFFSDRRDQSEKGIQRRKKFDELMDYLIAKGWKAGQARKELLKALHGEKNELVKIK